jgi:hypothetical protein
MSALLALQQDDLLQELVNKWLKQLTIDGLDCDDFLGFSGAFLIKERVPWKNPWIRLISGSNALKVIEAALSNAKGQKDALTFAKFHIIQNQELQLDELLYRHFSSAWKQIVYAGEDSVVNRPNNYQDAESLLTSAEERIQLCADAVYIFHGSYSRFTARWKTRFEYMMARCYFDLAVVHLASGAIELAKRALEEVEKLYSSTPDIAQKSKTHFKIHNTDYDREYPESEKDYDLLAHTDNIFVDTASTSINPQEGLGFFYPEIYEDGYNDYCVPSRESSGNSPLDLGLRC